MKITTLFTHVTSSLSDNQLQSLYVRIMIKCYLSRCSVVIGMSRIPSALYLTFRGLRQQKGAKNFFAK